MLTHPLTNFKIQIYYQKESRSNGVYLRSNLPKIKDGAYVINLDEYKSIGTHWIALYVSGDNVRYLEGFGVEDIPKEIKKFTDNKNIATIIYRIQANDSLVCGYVFIQFFDFICKTRN